MQNPKANGASGSKDSSASHAKPRIVLVDDEVLLTRALKLMLERTGEFIVFTENNPHKAMDLILEHRPHVIVLDIIMPGLSGTELANRLRQQPETQATPIIFYSGCHHGPPGFPFIAKPATKEEIIHSIRQALDR